MNQIDAFMDAPLCQTLERLSNYGEHSQFTGLYIDDGKWVHDFIIPGHKKLSERDSR